MTQFVYRLQPLMEQKERIRKDCEIEQRKREQELEAQIEKLHALERHLRELIEKREQLRRDLLVKPDKSAVTAHEASDRMAYIKVVGQQIDDAKSDIFSQRQVIVECESRVEQAKARVEEARREVEVLEKHKAKQEQRFQRIALAKEELALDEVGNVLYTTRRRDT